MNYDGSPYIFELRKCQKDQIQTHMTVAVSAVALLFFFFIGKYINNLTSPSTRTHTHTCARAQGLDLSAVFKMFIS